MVKEMVERQAAASGVEEIQTDGSDHVEFYG